MTPTRILLAILALSVLVIVHETGHYLAARLFGMRVVKFSIGFGPTIAKWQPRGSSTVFQIALIPFLAYVQIAGMNPAEENDPDDPELYANKGVFARFSAIFAGPFANYLLASLLVLVLALLGHHGENPPHDPMVIDQVRPGTPAAAAGLQQGDIVREADGKRVRNVIDLQKATAERAGKPTVYLVERAGKLLPPLTITPIQDNGRGIVGIVPKVLQEPMPLGSALVYSVAYPFKASVGTLQGIGMMFQRRTTEGLVGPVGMVKMLADKTDSPVQLADMLILMSVALGLFNLLPIPGLDGGRLVFLGYELITRKRANENVENLLHTVGLLLLLCLIALVTLRDVAG